MSLWFRWAACGFRREGRAHLDRLLLLSREDTPLRARALWLVGWLAAQEHALSAEELLAQAWTAAVMHADSDGLARIAHAYGVLALYREDASTAVRCLEEAARHRSTDPWFGPGPAHSWAMLAVALSVARPDRAKAAGRRAWEARHSDGDFWLYSTVLYAHALMERPTDSRLPRCAPAEKPWRRRSSSATPCSSQAPGRYWPACGAGHVPGPAAGPRGPVVAARRPRRAAAAFFTRTRWWSGGTGRFVTRAGPAAWPPIASARPHPASVTQCHHRMPSACESAGSAACWEDEPRTRDRASALHRRPSRHALRTGPRSRTAQG